MEVPERVLGQASHQVKVTGTKALVPAERIANAMPRFKITNWDLEARRQHQIARRYTLKTDQATSS